MSKRAGVVAALAVLLVVPLLPSGAGAAGSGAAASSAVNCWLYTPNPVFLNVASPVPGASVTLSGTAGPAETVNLTLTLAGAATPAVATTAVTDGAGAWSKTVTIPSSAAPGPYRAQVVSPFCGTAGNSFNVRYADNRCTTYRAYTAYKSLGFSTWQQLGVFNFTRPVTIRVIKDGGATTTIFGPGSLSAGQTVSFNPAALANGWYTISEIGTSPTVLVSRTANCGRVNIQP